MLAAKVVTTPTPTSPQAQSNHIFSKWDIDSSLGGFVDEAACKKVAVCEEAHHNNTVTFSASSAQVDAYSPGEDRIYLNEKDNLFAVFDGHGGDICSKYIADKLPKQLLCSLKKRQPLNESDYTSILKSTFMQVDEQFLNEHKLVVKTSPAGSCGVTVLVRNDSLYVCNLGDSRVLLGSRTQKWSHKLLTNDHNTKNEKERQLVKQRTTDPMPIRGHVTNKVEGERIGGILMVTRAFGDGIFKRKDMSLHPLIQHLPYITSEPEVTIHKFSPADRYAVISSDGLYEYFTPAVVAEIVEKHLESNSDGPKIAAALLEAQFETIGKLVGKTADQIKHMPNRKTFMDDTSVIIILFEHPSGGAAK
jgi:pyruvate dehydrogenase phosphatase